MAQNKRVLRIEGYGISLPERPRVYTVQVLSCDNCVVEFEDLNCAQMPVLIHALEQDENVEKYVVADKDGAYVI